MRLGSGLTGVRTGTAPGMISTTPDRPTPWTGYKSPDCYDEVFTADGEVRPQYAALFEALERSDLTTCSDEIRAHIDERGVAFGGEDGHPFALDPIPRILTREEWTQVANGVQQRVRALDLFLDDVYGEQRAVAEGVVPGHVVAESAYFEKDLVGMRPAGGARISLAGLDIVRDADGSFLVLEDNVRTPSGIAYAMAASEGVAHVLPKIQPAAETGEESIAALRRAMEASAPDVDGELVLLTDGEENSAWYEHHRIAEMGGLVLATVEDLTRRGDEVRLADGRRVRSLYRRTGEDRVREESGAFTPLAELLVEPLRTGAVGVVNWFGNGVADDKNVYAYVEDLVRFYLDEEPAIRSVATYDLQDPERRTEVLDRLAELVVKPRSGQGGEGVVVGPTATVDQLREATEAIRAEPQEWIVQDVVRLSTHPTVVDGRLAPRHVDLRPFAIYDGQEVVVPPGGLTRVALQEGSMVVNSSQDGGGKATWVAR